GLERNLEAPVARFYNHRIDVHVDDVAAGVRVRVRGRVRAVARPRTFVVVVVVALRDGKVEAPLGEIGLATESAERLVRRVDDGRERARRPDRERVEGPRAVLALELEQCAVDGDAKRPAAARRQRGCQFLDERVDLVRVEAERARGRDVRVSAQIARRPRRRFCSDGDEAPRARHGDVDQAVPAAASVLRHVVDRLFWSKGRRRQRHCRSPPARETFYRAPAHCLETLTQMM
ncbi:unnamed protein product, partial [Pelagomonas calceolata]